MKTVTVGEYHVEIKAQGVPKEHVAFRCPVCGTVQSAADLIAAGAGRTFDDIERYLGFSCVGRFTAAGQHKRGAPPGRGCNWTLGGFFKIHKMEIVTDDGERHPIFELATQEEARAHMSGVNR